LLKGSNFRCAEVCPLAFAQERYEIHRRIQSKVTCHNPITTALPFAPSGETHLSDSARAADLIAGPRIARDRIHDKTQFSSTKSRAFCVPYELLKLGNGMQRLAHQTYICQWRIYVNGVYDQSRNRPLADPTLARRGGVDRQCVKAAGEFPRQCRIDHAVTFEPALSFERLRHDIDPEVSLPARPVSGMPFVPVRFILHLQTLRGEGFGQLLCDDIGGSHALAPRQAGTAGQCRFAARLSVGGIVKS